MLNLLVHLFKQLTDEEMLKLLKILPQKLIKRRIVYFVIASLLDMVLLNRYENFNSASQTISEEFIFLQLVTGQVE